ncbi:MAG: hypothetical protein K2F81_02770 [Ruminococcus sp.]|nr:hypothetical protein [Ruminococcus sp.]
MHGKKWIEASNDLVSAMTIGEKLGCRELGCSCGKYEIYDNKLKTSDIQVMIKNVIKK